jgi:hypothetical protein
LWPADARRVRAIRSADKRAGPIRGSKVVRKKISFALGRTFLPSGKRPLPDRVTQPLTFMIHFPSITSHAAPPVATLRCPFNSNPPTSHDPVALS